MLTYYVLFNCHLTNHQVLNFVNLYLKKNFKLNNFMNIKKYTRGFQI